MKVFKIGVLVSVLILVGFSCNPQPIPCEVSIENRKVPILYVGSPGDTVGVSLRDAREAVIDEWEEVVKAGRGNPGPEYILLNELPPPTTRCCNRYFLKIRNKAGEVEKKILLTRTRRCPRVPLPSF